MNPDSPKTPREEMEAWLTALLLGELSAGEAAAVRELMKHDAELAKLHARLQQSIALLREAVPHAETPPIPADSLKLSDERRKKLLAAFAIPPLKPDDVKPRRKVRFRLVAVLAMVGVVSVLAAMFLPALSRSKSRSQLGYGITPLPRSRTGRESEEVQFRRPDRIGPELARTETRGEAVTATISQDASGVRPANVVGYVNLPPAATNLMSVANRIETRGDAAAPVDAVVFGGNAKVRGVSDYQEVLMESRRTLGQAQTKPAAAEPIPTPAPPVQIVLPTPPPDDVAGVAAQQLFQQNQAVGSAFSLGKPASVGVLEKVGDGASRPAEGADKQATIGAALRGFYDDSANKGVFSFGVAAGDKLGKDGRATALHDSFGFEVAHASDPLVLGDTTYSLPSLNATNNLGFGTFKPDELGRVPESSVPTRAGAAAVTEPTASERFSRLPAGQGGGGAAGGEIAGRGVITAPSEPADKVPVLGDLSVFGKLFRSESTKVTSNIVTSNGQTLEFLGYDDPGQFVPQGQFASTGTGGIGVPATAQLPVPRYRLKPTDSAAKSSDVGGAVLPRPLEESLRRTANEAVTASLQPMTGNPAYGAPQPAAGGLPATATWSGGALTSKPPEADFRSYDFFTAGRRVEPQQEAVRLELTDSSASVPAKPAGVANIVLPTTPAPETVGLLTGALRVPVRQPADPAPVSRVEISNRDAGKSADLIQEGRVLLEAGRIAEAEARLKTAQAADPQSAAAGYYLNFVKEARQRDAARRAGQTSKGSIVTTGLPAEPLAEVKLEAQIAQRQNEVDARPNAGGAIDPATGLAVVDQVGGQLETRKFHVDPDVFRQGIESLSVGDTGGVRGDGTSGVPRVITAGGGSGGSQPASGRAGGVRFLTRTNDMEKFHQGVNQFFSTLGVDLNTSGKSVFFNDRTGDLLVRGTKEDLDTIAEIAQTFSSTPSEAKEDSPMPRRAATNAPVPQPEIQTSENNFSTFSLNVRDVSFKLAMASLEKGQMPDAASIRSEEFINAFDYRDPEPAAGAPIAFAWERARYPFAHNRDLLRFSLKTAAAGRQAGRPLNIVLLLDNSGSMERADRVRIIREALRVLAAQLQPQDKLSVILFARTARLVADGVSGDKAREVAEQVSGLTPQGGTNLEDAMNLAYQTAAKHYLAGGINRVVLLTDGAANLGDVEPDSLKNKVETHRRQGIALDCFGIGWEGFNDNLLEVLSRNGDGRYGFINSPEEAATEFAGQLAGALKVAASDVKVQVEFNPKRVNSYRQIGYAKHQLTKEQFRDNTVDAAEIAAQEAGNALYTVEVNPAGEGPLCTVRVRYKIPGTTDYREQAWDVPFTGNALSLEQSSTAMRLAASASAFAEWLVASPFAGEVTPDRLLGLLRGVPEVFGADSSPKKLEWMIRQAKSLEGK